MPWPVKQSAIADFALEALTSNDVDASLNQACIVVARGLSVPISKCLQVLPGTDDLLLRAAVGLSPKIAVPGETRVPGGRRSAAGYALTIDQPVISHIQSETRFEISEIVRRARVTASANVVIPTREGPFGALEVDSLEDRSFSQEDLDFLRIYATLVGAAVDRQRDTARISTLMTELQHRVKNDLQVIIALLSIESSQAENIETKARIEGVLNRVESLRLVHERLFVAGRVGSLDLADYVRELCLGRFRMHGQDAESAIRLNLALAPVIVDHDRAVSIGLIINEFLTNSLKYAFPLGRGEVRVELGKTGPKLMTLRLADDGIGLPPRKAGAQGMGMRLIEMMAQQAGGTIEWAGDGGTSLTLTLTG